MNIRRIITAVRRNFKSAWDDRVTDLTGELHEPYENLNELIYSKKIRESKKNEDSTKRNTTGGRHAPYVA